MTFSKEESSADSSFPINACMCDSGLPPRSVRVRLPRVQNLEEDHNEQTSNPEKTMDSSVCGESKLKPGKHKCPGCSIRSCGLPCVKTHKHRTGCNGRRKVIDFVTVSKFEDISFYLVIIPSFHIKREHKA
ncbi:hypothetical protein DY000_02058225 [Brassica cretica]|uniref:HIT-type domain-containing protein n=1 Tax=Brassica cretica TaxID=69181 RepID=A0ABQ7AEZ6_BRACR|nr:hypothetical protein DY000_02058225 [Brassica cretica]